MWFDYFGYGVLGGNFEDLCVFDWLEEFLVVFDWYLSGDVVFVGFFMGGWIVLLFVFVWVEIYWIRGLVLIVLVVDFIEELMWK